MSAELSDDVRAKLDRYGLAALATPGTFYATVDEVVAAYDVAAGNPGRTGSDTPASPA